MTNTTQEGDTTGKQPTGVGGRSCSSHAAVTLNEASHKRVNLQPYLGSDFWGLVAQRR